MAVVSADRANGSRAGALLAACVAEHGSAGHPYLAGTMLSKGPDAARNLADAVHFLCVLHGRHPGVIDLAGGRTVEAPARAWLLTAAQAMASERAFLTRLAVAAGPIPSTPGGGEAESVVHGQRTALATLAQSERRGCALGAALSLALDWAIIRSVLDAAAARFGVEPPAALLGGEAELRSLTDAVVANGGGAMERAILFGAQQIAVQHHGLWDLLEARQQARRDS